jgi:methionyl-tRNA synthetase
MVKALGIMLWPYIPCSSEKILAMIGEPMSVRWQGACEDIEPRKLTVEPIPIFRKIEVQKAARRCPNLRVARITHVDPHPSGEKLYLLTVALGTETRRIVSGIREWYRPEDLMGKLIILVANLKPATIRGVESKGMLLAAEGKKHPCSLIVPGGDAKEGDAVSGYECEEVIDIKEFKAFDLKVYGITGDGALDIEEKKHKLSEKERPGEVVVDLTVKDKPTILKCNGRPLVPLKEVGIGAKVL